MDVTVNNTIFGQFPLGWVGLGWAQLTDGWPFQTCGETPETPSWHGRTRLPPPGSPVGSGSRSPVTGQEICLDELAFSRELRR
eukprot:2757420-Prorocentrum_lima.AAC.1